MPNLTIVIDADLLKRARLRALQQGQTVNSLLRDYLEQYANADATRARLAEFVTLARTSKSSSGSTGRSWTRDELYER